MRFWSYRCRSRVLLRVVTGLARGAHARNEEESLRRCLTQLKVTAQSDVCERLTNALADARSAAL